jgi:hypothetical protein
MSPNLYGKLGFGMSEKNKRSPVFYLIMVWMAINILLMATMILNGDFIDLNNWLEIALWSISIACLLSMRKWGIAFATFTLIYTFSTSMGILIYYQIWLNAIRVIINAAIIIYLFKTIFEDKYKK